MFVLIALVLVAIVALIVASVAIHILFSPLLLLAAGILLWMVFRRRRYQR